MNLPFGSSIVRGYADILNLLATGLNSLFQRSVFPRVAVLCPITAGGDINIDSTDFIGVFSTEEGEA
jgi:hypothetical protein